MAETVFRSAGVSTQEIDLSGPAVVSPSGVPAGVIGTATQGRAFVPITVPSYQNFVAEFGKSDGKKFGPVAMSEWLDNASAGTYVRLLGIGDGLKRVTVESVTSSWGDPVPADGGVKNAGFVVGQQLPQADGNIGANAKAGAKSALGTGGPAPVAGRTFLLGCFMSESAGSTIFSDAGIQRGTTSAASITITATGLIGTGQVLTLTNPAGLSLDFTSINGDGTDSDGTLDPPEFDRNAESYGLAGIKTAIEESSLASSFTVGAVDTDGGYFLTITQVLETSDGNTAVGNNCVGYNIDSAGDATDTFFTGGSSGASNSQPILRGILMAPSGVLLSLSSSNVVNNAPVSAACGFFEGDKADLSNTSGGRWLGSVDISATGQSAFTLLLNGHTATVDYPSALTSSFDTRSKSYFAEALNTDPTKLESAGHLLYAHYDIHPAYAVVTGSGVNTAGSELPAPGATTAKLDCGFLVTSSLGRNSGSTAIPNFENFNDRFATATATYVISQNFGGKAENLFKLHALNDGEARGGATKAPHIPGSNSKFKISIRNLQKSTDPNNDYGTFDLVVRDFNDNDLNVEPLQTFVKMNLDPGSENYIGRVIGDQRMYYDFDKDADAQKLVVEGNHPVTNPYIRVQPSNAVKQGTANSTALPLGFRGPAHLVTSGSSIVMGYPTNQGISATMLRGVTQPPVPFRRTIAQGADDKKNKNMSFYWGVQFEQSDSVTDPNKTTLINKSLPSWTKYFSKFHTSDRNTIIGGNEGTADSGGTVLDADRFCNNIFSLERVQVITGSDDRPASQYFASASYRRAGTLDSAIAKSRFLSVEKDFGLATVTDLLKFSFFVQCGFDGTCIFNTDKAEFANAAALREMDQPSTTAGQGGTEGPTVAAYRKAIDVMGEKSTVDIKLLAIPGARHTSITNYAIDAIESRFDALYIMDVSQRDAFNSVITSSGEPVVVNNTVTAFQNRALDTSFAAAYFPNVTVTDPSDRGKIMEVPPSAAVLGAFALNDAVAHPWFAPAGFTRGVMKNVVETRTWLDTQNLDTLYSADINPVTSFPTTPGVTVWGQKTLLAAQSALDRINVRRLLIEVRRQVKAVGNSLLFEPNRASTLARFSSAVNPILGRIQQQQGLDRYKVVIDTTTTTQADVENNTIRGKIFLQPTRSLEFISLDFVVTNAGTEI
jgi:hypothetical protein